LRLTDAIVHSRDNNFNLMRLLAALAVLIAHSWPLALGRSVPDPLAVTTGLGLGGIAVDVFFVTSGFLVTGSLLRRGNILEFVVARALRIYPALVVAVLACVALGLALTVLPWAEFLSHPRTLRFLWRNASAIRSGEFYLPGVFDGNPTPRAVNGSLWTLVWEVRMYLALVVLWCLAGLRKQPRRGTEAAILVLALVTTALYLFDIWAPGAVPGILRVKNSLAPAFLLGAAFYVLRARMQFRLSYAWGSRPLLQTVYFLTLPYLLLFLAYVPAGPVRRFNDLGDYSYGIYILAFPVQQTIAAFVPGVSVLQLAVGAAVVTLALAWCSWTLVEQPALRRKEAVARTLRRLVATASWRRPRTGIEVGAAPEHPAGPGKTTVVY
jgi:peptidoglycan/LPS O-acetylase OafA/YrhL